jgi:hypothetical protein
VSHAQAQGRDQARTMVFAGRRRPPEGWMPGIWHAEAEVSRDGVSYRLERSFEVAP